MFDIAFSELIVIGIIALIVLGPKRLPEVARTAGRWAGRLRQFVENVKRDMDVELRRDELAELRKVKDQLVETRQMFEQTASSTLAAIPGSPLPEPPAPETPPRILPETVAVPVRRPAARKKKSVKKKSAGTHGRATRKPR